MVNLMRQYQELAINIGLVPVIKLRHTSIKMALESNKHNKWLKSLPSVAGTSLPLGPLAWR